MRHPRLVQLLAAMSAVAAAPTAQAGPRGILVTPHPVLPPAPRPQVTPLMPASPFPNRSPEESERRVAAARAKRDRKKAKKEARR